MGGLKFIHPPSFKFHYCGFITFFFFSLWANFYSLNCWGPSLITMVTDLSKNIGHKGSRSHPLQLWLLILPHHCHPVPLERVGAGRIFLKEQTEENLSSADS